MSRCGRVDLDEATARRLCALTSEFYRANAESFSQTRQSPWRGWKRALAAAGVASADADNSALQPPVGASAISKEAADLSPQSPVGANESSRATAGLLRVLDLACGNLRFEWFLADRLGVDRVRCFAVDNCDPLVDQAACVDRPDRAESADRPVWSGRGQTPGVLPSISFQNLDVIDALATGSLRDTLAVPDASCDLGVAFGFMHHVPRETWRADLLRALVAKTRPGGHVVVSFWRFLNSEKLAKKAHATTAQARAELNLPALPPNDFLLGWQDTSGLYRYCHHFDEAEIERLLAVVADDAQPVARFAADGKTGNLNEYVILRVR